MFEEQGIVTIRQTLVAENQSNENTAVMKVQLEVRDGFLFILELLQKANIDYQNKTIRLYDFQRNVYNVIHPESKIPVTWIQGNSCDVILMKLGTKIHTVKSQSGSASQDAEKLSETSSVKKQRSKQRVIFEVIQIVKKWRELHNSRNSIKKMSLLEAAKMLGMPKKSLDDYYYQLRLGEKYGFDFQTHLFDRVGVLRTYLKKFKGHTPLDKYQKHPKNLRIIQKFEELSELFYSGRNSNQFNRTSNAEMDQQILEENEYNEGNDREEQQIDYHKMNDFRSEFEYLLDEKDPFLVGDYNFKKKMMGDVDEDQIFF